MALHSVYGLDLDTLKHALRVAAQKFKDDANNMRHIQPNALITANVAQQIAAEFDRYERGANEMLEAIEINDFDFAALVQRDL